MNARLDAWRVLRSALFERGAAGSERLGALLRSPQLSWPQLIDLAGNDYVTPSFWLGLVAARQDTAIPADASQYLRAVYQMNLRRNEAMLEQTDEAIAALNGVGVAPLLLKGAAYLKLGVHADPGARVAADLDMLVPAGAADTARRALEQIGYAPVAGSLSRATHHLAPLARRGGAGPIELHVAALPKIVRHALPTADAWLNRVEHESRKFSVLSSSHMVLHRFVHDQIVDRYEALRKIALRSLVDLLEFDNYYGTAVDWAHVYALARRAQYASSFKNYLYVARRTAGLEVRFDARFGARQRAYLRACDSALRWNAVRAGFGVLNAMSAFCIKKRHGERQSLVSMSRHRVRVAADILRSRLNPS